MRARILSLFILLLGLSVMAGSIDMKEWAPIPEADLQLTDNPKEPGAKAMLLFKHACRDMYEYCEHGAVKIFNQAGNDLADFSLPEDVKDIRARTIKPDGTWVELDKDSIRKRLVYKRKRESMKQKVFSFEGVEPGVVLEYKYKYRLSDRERIVYVWPFQTDLFCRETWLDLDEKMIRNYNRMIIDTYFQAGVISYPKEGNIRYEATNIPALPDEDFLPPKLETSAFFVMLLGMPAVDGARSLDLTTESGKQEYIKLFWQDYGEKWAKSFAKFMKSGKEVRSLLDTIRQSDTRDLPIERKIYDHVVANFENLSYQTEPDSATADKKARRKYKDRNNVADVIKLGYGNKGQLTQLCVALLQEAGLDARLAYVCGRDESFFRNYLLVDQFDEPLAVIKTADGMVCLDPATPYCDYGIVNWNKEGVQGMLFSRDSGEMFTTPVAPATTNVIERMTRVQFTEEGITGQITVRPQGIANAYYKNLLDDDTDDEHREYLEDYLKEHIADARLESFTIHHLRDRQAPLEIVIDFSLATFGTRTQTRHIFQPALMTNNVRDVFVQAYREFPVYFTYPRTIRDTVIYELPDGTTVSNMPEAARYDGPVGEYSLTVAQEGQTLTVTRVFRREGFYFKSEHYPDLRMLYNQARKYDDSKVILKTEAITP